MDFINIKRMALNDALALSPVLEFAVVPGFSSEFYFTTYLDDTFIIIVSGTDLILRENSIRLGDLISIERENGDDIVVWIRRFEFISSKDFVYKFKTKNGNHKLYKGQSVQIRGGNHTGKTSGALKIANAFENKKFKTYRLLIGQRKEDSLGEGSITINSISDYGYQINRFFSILDLVIRDVHKGIDCCFIIDSMDRYVTLYGESERKLSRALNHVHKLLSLSGDFKSGSLTFIYTNIRYDLPSIKKIDMHLKSSSDESILLLN